MPALCTKRVLYQGFYVSYLREKLKDIPVKKLIMTLIIPEDHAVGLATFTIMAGLGGSLGYAMGGIDWGALGEWKQPRIIERD